MDKQGFIWPYPLTRSSRVQGLSYVIVADIFNYRNSREPNQQGQKWYWGVTKTKANTLLSYLREATVFINITNCQCLELGC